MISAATMDERASVVAVILWVANCQSCRKDARTNSLAVTRAGTDGPESMLRIPRWVTQEQSTRRRSIGRHTSRPSELPGRLGRAHTLTPPSASDRALDSAAASDTNRHSPAERTSRLGRMSSVHTPATRRSARRRLGDRFRERLRISSWCLTRTDSATTARAPPGPVSRATVANRWRNRTARSRMAPIVTSWRNPRNAKEFGIRHAQAQFAWYLVVGALHLRPPMFTSSHTQARLPRRS
jgi:hypothetical protein